MTKLSLDFLDITGKLITLSLKNLPNNISHKNILMMFYNLYCEHNGVSVDSAVRIVKNKSDITYIRIQEVSNYFSDVKAQYVLIDLENRYTTSGLFKELNEKYLGKNSYFHLTNVDENKSSILIDPETTLLDLVKRSLLPNMGGELSWYVSSVQDILHHDQNPLLGQLITESIIYEITNNIVGVSSVANYALANVNTSFFKDSRGLTHEQMSETYSIYKLVKSHLNY